MSLAAELPTPDAIAGRWRVVERDVRRYLSEVADSAPSGVAFLVSRFWLS
jgi:hypothetical protein